MSLGITVASVAKGPRKVVVVDLNLLPFVVSFSSIIDFSKFSSIRAVW